MASSLGLSYKISPSDAEALRKGRVNVLRTSAHQEDEDIKGPDLPYLVVSCDELLGYQPDPKDMKAVRAQWMAAMWSTSKSTPPTENFGTPPPEFDQHASQLLEQKIAMFGWKTSSTQKMSPFLPSLKYLSARSSMVVIYPPRLLVQDGDSMTELSTREIWTETYRYCCMDKSYPRRRPRQSPSERDDNDNSSSTRNPEVDGERDDTSLRLRLLWQKVLHSLLQCQTGLIWKWRMSKELHRLWHEEQTRLDHLEWQRGDRRKKLDELYSVRETLVHQRDLAIQHWEKLHEQRRQKAAAALRQQRSGGRGAGGLQGFDFESTVLSFPADGDDEDQFAFLSLDRDDEYIEEDDWGLLGDEDSYKEASSSDDDDDDENAELSNERESDIQGPESEENNALHQQEPVDAETSLSFGDQEDPVASAFIGRSERAARRKQLRRIQQNQAQEDIHRAKLEDALAQEKEALEANTSPEFLSALARKKALEEKVAQVDDLLESLQEEEWAAEEEEEQSDDRQAHESKALVDSSRKPSILDLVLSNIFGALPRDARVDPHLGLKKVQERHFEVIRAWNDYFGRLPPTSQTAPGRDSFEEKDDPVATEPPASEVDDAVQSSEERRHELGIVDNDQGIWDDADADTDAE